MTQKLTGRDLDAAVAVVLGTGVKRLTVACVVRCKSTEILRKLKEMVKMRIGLDHVVEKVYRSFPGGVEKREQKFYRLGDYFENIELKDNSSSEEPLSFKLEFHVQPGVDSFWKDLVVSVLSSIRNESGVSAGRIQST